MKKILLIAALATLCSVGLAQDSQPSFFGTVAGYFTSFNTNLTTFKTSRAEIWSGATYQNGLSLAGSVGVDLNLKKGGGLYAESETRLSNVDGIVVSQMGGVGYSIVHYDTKLSLGVNGGWDWTVERPVMCAYLDVRKALTPNTFAGIRGGYQTTFDHHSPGAPIVTGYLGFKF